MTNKPMLSVERELLATALKADASIGATATDLVKGWVAMVELRALLDNQVLESQYDGMTQAQARAVSDGVDEILHGNPPTGWLPCSPNILESGVDCATSPRWSSKEWDGHSHWHPAPIADHTQCEECKGWGYHENHYDGGGTECGECSGSGKAPVEQFSGDTVVCRRYQLEQHPGQNFYHYDLEPVYGSVPVTVSELITMAESAPVAVAMPDRLKAEPFTTIDRGSKNYKAGYNAALAEVARLNEVKP